MSKPGKESRTAKYIIRVHNHLDSHWEQWFEGMKITHVDGGETVLSGNIADQSALHGLLEKVHNLNLTLILVQKVESGEDDGTADSGQL